MDESYYKKLLSYALKLLSKRRYTKYGIYKKLKKKDLGEVEDIDRVIERLKEYKYIDDFSFAKDYIRNRILLNPRGRRMLKVELRRKGIDKHVIEDAVYESVIDEDEIAKKILKKKKRIINKFSGQKRRQKIFSLLASRGINNRSIYKVLDQ